MSKAFRPNDESVEEDLDLEPAPLPPGTKNYMTPGGCERMRREHRQLVEVARPEVVRVVSWAASNGDRSENADYLYGKRKLREIDRRIRFLERRLADAEVVDPAGQTGDAVRFGATVTVRDEQGVEKNFSLVGVDEIDLKRGYLSWHSPMGRALLGAKAGEAVTVRTPKGEEEIEVVAVRYVALDTDGGHDRKGGDGS